MAADALQDRLAELATRFGLTSRQRRQLSALLGLLAGDPNAPTAIRDPSCAIDQHVADSLVALEVEALGTAGIVADLGSGAGFPGVALAIALPQARFYLLESQRRRCLHLEQIAGALGLANVTVVCARAEQWKAGTERCDAVLARALASQPVVLEYAAPLLRAGGSLIDWRAMRDHNQERQALAAAAQLGLRQVEIRSVHPFAQARARNLHVYLKLRPTPGRFPRRPGIAVKRPLGASAPAAPRPDWRDV